MSYIQLFDLEKIRNLTYPIEELQAKLNQLTENSKYANDNIKIIEKEFEDEKLHIQIGKITALLETISRKISKISKINLNKFLDLQNQLIKKYKESFKDKLLKLKLNQEMTKIIGLLLIEEKKVSKIIDNVSFIPSIEIPLWFNLLDSLKYNTLFLKSVEKIRIFYQGLLQTRLNEQLSKIPEGTDPKLIKDFEISFKKDSTLTFNNFLRTIESQQTKQTIADKKRIIIKIKEQEELEKLKKKTTRTKRDI